MSEATSILIAAIPTVIVALVGAGGFWGYLEYRDKARREERNQKWDTTIESINSLSEQMKQTSDQLLKVEKQIRELYDGQMQCAVKLNKIEDIENKFGNLENLITEVKSGSVLSIAVARDRLNYLANKYMKQGYIPAEDIIPFKLLGQAYIDSGGNTETKTKFLHCINELDVINANGQVVG